ncbi:Ig-like domain (group 4) [Caloramator quimbayensis]|uniref:Ig-like domain (Group 4) n=1 Tax=Caloramator quimbayensis TaxID=1147123 RepID=A0A1T4WID2_9CLOT|nr:Ig-like domain-containing protein [Caloramator quimbayensis]SKA76678.1 Ig-like domain (group 4) [Caloramator quimbayensis]
MAKAKKVLSTVLVALFTVFTVLSYVPAQTTKAAAGPTKITIVAKPQAEYKVGDRVIVKFNSAPYKGKVQYRAFLWKVGVGKVKELYPGYSKDYFYKAVCPGTSTFTIDVLYVTEPGTYEIVVGVKASGAKASTAKYVNVGRFVVKAKEEAKVEIKELVNPADVTVDEGAVATLPATVKAVMTDGTEKEVAVKWDAVDTTKAGEYTVNGTVEGTTLKPAVKVTVKAVAPTATVSAVGVKKLEVKFNKAVDDTKAKFEVKKDSILVNTEKVEFAADKKSAVITMATNLTKGEYTVSVSGLTETAISVKVTVDDVKVAKINILSTKAPRLSGNDKRALVSYEVLNQYGEKMTGQTISWTISTGKSVYNENTIDGTFEIEAAGTSDFIPGQIVYITGVHAASATVVNAQVEIALEAQANEVLFKGVYDTTNLKLVDLPAGFTDNRYVLLFQVKDQYGNIMSSPNLSKLVFTSNNPLFVSSDTANGAFAVSSDVTLDGATYKAVALKAGSSVNNGGTVTIQAISSVTGKISTYTVEAKALAAVKTFTMSAPSKMIAETEKVEIPFTAVDQYGNAVTKYSQLNGNVTLSPLYNGTGTSGLKFEEQNDGTAKLYYYAPATGASDNVDLPVYLTSIVTNGGNFSSLMVSVKEKARPTTIVGLDSTKSTYIAKGNYVDIEAADLIIQDQYGRTMTDSAVNAWVDAASENSIVVESTSTNSAFQVLLNNSDSVTQVISTTNSAVRIFAENNTNKTETIKFTLATGDNGANPVTVSTKSIVFTKVSKSEYVSFEVADFGKMYNNGNASAATPSTHNKTVKVYGVLANGTKVLLPAADYSLALTTSKLTTSGSIIVDVTSGGYAAADFVDNLGNAKDVKTTVIVTVNGDSGEALQILEKELVVSNEALKVATVTLDEDLVADGKAVINPTTGGVIDANKLKSVIYEVKDQYGVDFTENPVIIITNLVKVDGSTFTVTNNGTNSVSIANATMGDKFTATFKYASGLTVKVDFTVGLTQ